MRDNDLNNFDVRSYCKMLHVPLWKVAKYLNISEATMTRRLRNELSESEKKKIMKVAEKIATFKSEVYQ